MARYLVVDDGTPEITRYEPAPETKRPRRFFAGALFSSIREHWRIFTGVLCACIVVVTVATLLVPKQYTAPVKMIVGSVPTAAEGQQNDPTSMHAPPARQTADVNSDTIVDLIQEGSVADEVIAALKLDETRSQLLSRIGVKPVTNTPIVTLTATAGSPAQAVAIANAYANAFIDRDRVWAGAQAAAAQTYLQTAISKAQTSLQQANAALTIYQARYQIADPTLQTQPLLQHLEETEAKIEELQDDRGQAQAQLASTQTQAAGLPATIAGQQATEINPASTELRQQLAQTETQLAAARQRYTEQYPAVVALEQQRAGLLHQLAVVPATVAGQVIAIPNPVSQQLLQEGATLRSRIQGDNGQIAELQRQRASLAPQIAALPARTTQLNLLQEHAKLASDVYNALEQKYDDAVVAANSATSDVTILQPAQTDSVTVWPNLVFNVIASVVVGLLLALLAVAVASFVERRMREDRDVGRALGLPVVAIPSLLAEHQAALPRFGSATLDGFLQLCASLRILGRKSDNNVIVVTSPEQNDGKTTIAYCVALAMSQVRPRVLLIDADMRSPATHLQAKIENGSGLSDILSGRSSFDNVVFHYAQTLDILTAGPPPPNPVTLSGSSAFDDLLDLARQRYDCIVIDTHALGSVVDSALIATRADATVLVLPDDYSQGGPAGRAVARLRSLGIVNTVGVVVNRSGAEYVRTEFLDEVPALAG